MERMEIVVSRDMLWTGFPVLRVIYLSRVCCCGRFITIAMPSILTDSDVVRDG